MKRSLFLTVAAVLLSSGPAGADLEVYEYITDQKVTLDTATGNYWYYDLTDFAGWNYDDQIDAIANLGTYGNIAGGWHMATLDEMEPLWQNSETTIMANFEKILDTGGIEWWAGRYDRAVSDIDHAAAFVYDNYGTIVKSELSDSIFIYDTDEIGHVSAWVVSDQAVVPVPPALILGATGLLSSALGLIRLRRKHQ